MYEYPFKTMHTANSYMHIQLPIDYPINRANLTACKDN